MADSSALENDNLNKEADWTDELGPSPATTRRFDDRSHSPTSSSSRSLREIRLIRVIDLNHLLEPISRINRIVLGDFVAPVDQSQSKAIWTKVPVRLDQQLGSKPGVTRIGDLQNLKSPLGSSRTTFCRF